MKKQVESINYFKGISVVGIVLYHLFSLYMNVPAIVKTAANAGSSGVLVFFFCSGFLLNHSQHQNQRSFAAFVKRRFTSIYIPYIIVVLICAMIPLIPSDGNRWIALLSHIFQFRCVSRTYFASFGGHFWYVSTAFQLYAVFIPLFKLQQRVGKKLFFSLCAAVSIAYVIALAFLHLDGDSVLIRLFPKYLIFFAAGMTANELYGENKLSAEKLNSGMLAVLGFAGILIYGLTSKSALGRLINDIPEFIGVICLFTLAYKLNLLKGAFAKLNEISYEIYLIHMPVMTILFALSDGSLLRDIVLGLASLALTAALSVPYHLFCKKAVAKIQK